MDTSLIANGDWIAVQVRCGWELKVGKRLEECGYEGFVPTRIVRKQRRGRNESVESSLFPGYAFCRFVVNPTRRILEVAGVIRLVGSGPRLVPVPDVEIESLRRVVTSDSVIAPCAPPTRGQPVFIHRGALSGVRGVLVESRGTTRLLVSVSLLGRAVGVEINSVDLLAITRPPETSLSSRRGSTVLSAQAPQGRIDGTGTPGRGIFVSNSSTTGPRSCGGLDAGR